MHRSSDTPLAATTAVPALLASPVLGLPAPFRDLTVTRLWIDADIEECACIEVTQLATRAMAVMPDNERRDDRGPPGSRGDAAIGMWEADQCHDPTMPQSRRSLLRSTTNRPRGQAFDTRCAFA